MIVRREQMAAFDAAAERNFLDRVCAYLRENPSPAVSLLPDDLLRKNAEAGIRRARSHGIESGPMIAAFVDTMFQVAPNFDQQPDVALALADKALTPDERMEFLAGRVPEQAWEEAADLYDLDAWDE